MFKKLLPYQNYHGVRKPGVVYKMNYKELSEFALCYNYPIYFIEKYCMTMTPNGFEYVTLRDYQKEVIQSFQDNRFNIIMNSRQTGMSTIIGFLMLWVAMFRYERNIVLLSNKMCSGTEVIKRIRETYRNLPYFLKPGVETFANNALKFENGCFIKAVSRSANGISIDDLFIQDYAHVNPNVLADYFPLMSTDRKNRMFIQSTPNGFNQFYELFSNAEQGKNSFIPTRVYWWQVPGRNNKWKENEIKILGPELFAQEYDLQFLTLKRGTKNTSFPFIAYMLIMQACSYFVDDNF